MDTTTATLRTVSLHALALDASRVPGEADHEAAIASLVGQRAVFYTFEGRAMFGVLEAPLTGPASSGGYPVIRFPDGRYGRADDRIVLVVED